MGSIVRNVPTSRPSTGPATIGPLAALGRSASDVPLPAVAAPLGGPAGTTRTAPPAAAGPSIGRSLPRFEDERLLRGRGRYVSDLVAAAGPDVLHVEVLRSPHAHALIGHVDTRAARTSPGVVAVLTAEDLAGVGDLPCDWSPPGAVHEALHPVLARDRVRYVGEPVAVVAASTAHAALDALDAIRVDYEPLPCVVDQEEALRDDAPVLHAAAPRNLAFRLRLTGGDADRAFARAEIVVRRRTTNNRVAPVPLEGRAVLSEFDAASGRLLHHSSSQLPHVHARSLAACLGFPLHKLQLVAPDIGGGFGAKLGFYAEDVLCALLTMRTGRPCAWVEGRTEGFCSTTHGRDHVQYAELAARRDGTVTGLRVRLVADLGAYALGMGPGVPAVNAGLSVTGPYRIANVETVVEGVHTNRTPTGPYRGAGHPEATFLIERMMDELARTLHLDPVDLRRRNLVPVSAMPHRLPTGLTLDSGDYAANLDAALALADYPGMRRRQAEARREGRYLGIGVTIFSENSGAAPSMAMGAIGFRRAGHESARVVVHADGRATVFSGGQSQGQGHATSLAQIAADGLGIPPEDVEVVQGDTRAVPFGTGTYNSRTIAVGGSAVHTAARTILDKVRRIAAYKLGRRVADLDYTAGVFRVRPATGVGSAAASTVTHLVKRVEDRVKGVVFTRISGVRGLVSERGADSVTFADAAREAHLGHDVPLGMAPGLDETVFFDPKDMPFAYGTHISLVEVDPETGHVGLLRHVAVDDCGRVINPLLADGQIHGGAAQGIGQALMEEVVHSGAGEALSDSLSTYAVPHATDLPDFETGRTTTPTTLNPLGAKGVGEGATIGATPAVVSAVLDALSPLGVTDIAVPLTPVRVWHAVDRAARRREPAERSTTDA